MKNTDDRTGQLTHFNGSPAELVVYFDGGCPLCMREIAFYQKLDQRGNILWEDVSTEAAVCPVGLDRQTLLKRFHVKDCATGEVYSGASGFARLWRSMPGIWRHIGRVAQIRGISGVLELGYRITLKIRPGLARRLRP